MRRPLQNVRIGFSAATLLVALVAASSTSRQGHAQAADGFCGIGGGLVCREVKVCMKFFGIGDCITSYDYYRASATAP